MMQLFSSFAADELSRALGVPLLQRAQSIAATTDPVTTITMRAEKRIEKKNPMVDPLKEQKHPT